MSELKRLALHAGDIIRSKFVHNMKIEWKGDETPLTDTDTEVNRLVLHYFAEHYSHIKVVAEEGSNEIGGSEWLVVCDPMDGTIPYTGGFPASSFCISLLHNGIPVSAIIYDPFMERMWNANKDGGAFLNDRPVKVSGHTTLNRSMVCIVPWHKAPHYLMEVAEKIGEAGAKWINPASIAYFGGLVASGQFHATIFPGNKAWETAAMSLIVEEAGGRSTDLFGKPHDRFAQNEISGHVVSNGHIHNQILELIGGCIL